MICCTMRFFAQKWEGEIDFRGLDDRNYKIKDNVNNKEIEEMSGNGKLNVQFDEYLLIKAIPE